MSVEPKFDELRDGEWHLTRGTGIKGKHYHQCCGCGLVHEVKYRVYEIVQKRPSLLRQLNLKNIAIATAWWRVK